MNNNLCQKHNRTLEVICQQCNILLCYKCTVNHIQENTGHQCIDSDDIKHSLLHLNNNSNSNDDNNTTSDNSNSSNNKLKVEIEKIWNFLKKSSDDIQHLKSKDDEISNHFRSLHEYLQLEEHKLKKPIIADIDRIKESIKKEIDHLQSLINISRIITTDTTSNNLISPDQDEGDKTIDYSIDKIIDSIQNSSSLDLFILNNNNTIFNQSNYNDILNNYKDNLNNMDLIILQLIINHNNKFKDLIDINSKNANDNLYYILKIDQSSIQKIKDMINKSIELNVQQIINSINSKSKYILSTHSFGNGTTLIDISDNNNISFEEINFKYQTTWTGNSIVRIGDLIYIFGYINRYCIISIQNRSIVHEGTIDLTGNTSICYDGKDYIYIHRNNQFKNERIAIFNVTTRKHQELYEYNNFNNPSSSPNISFFYKDHLYTLRRHTIYIFNPTNLQTSTHLYEPNLAGSKAACSDGGKFLYVLLKDKNFIKIDIETKVSNYLQSLEADLFEKVSMVYDESFIYILGGKSIGNYCYSINNDIWSTFQNSDQYDRKFCGSVLIN